MVSAPLAAQAAAGHHAPSAESEVARATRLLEESHCQLTGKRTWSRRHSGDSAAQRSRSTLYFRAIDATAPA